MTVRIAKDARIAGISEVRSDAVPLTREAPPVVAKRTQTCVIGIRNIS